MSSGAKAVLFLAFVLSFSAAILPSDLMAGSSWEEVITERTESLPSGDGGGAVRLGGIPEYGPAPGDQWFPDVAFGDGVTLVTWENAVLGPSSIYAGRVFQGEALDPSGFSVGTGEDTERFPACAFGDGSFLVVWQKELSGIMGRRVSAAGGLLEAQPFAICSDTEPRSPAIAASDSLFLVVWQDARGADSDIYGCRVTFSGEVLDPDGFLISDARFGQTDVSVASDGTDFLVVWQDRRVGNWGVYGARVTVSGSVLDAFGLPICDPLDGSTRILPDVAFCNSSYVVLWQDDRNVQAKLFGTRVSVSGAVLDGTGVEVCSSSGEQFDPGLSFDGENLLVTWRNLSQNEKVMSCLVDTTFSSGASTALCEEGELQLAPSVCLADTEWLVAWMDFRSGTDDDVYACRVSFQGIPLDSCGFLVSMAANSQRRPRATYDGTMHLVIWEDDRAGDTDIYGTRVSPSGEVLDTLGIPVAAFSGNQYSAEVTSNGTDFLVAWTDDSVPTDIYGHRVNSSGVVMDGAPIAISTSGGMQAEPSLATDGTTYLCVWEDYRNGNDGDVYGARISSSGLVLDASGLLVTIGGVEHSQRHPRVDFLDTCYVVVWEDDRNGDWDVYAARVTPLGEVLDSSGVRVSHSSLDERSPGLCGLDHECIVLWEERSSGSSDSDVRCARLSSSGELLDTLSVLVNGAAGLQLEPHVAPALEGFLAVWTDTREGNKDIYGTPVTLAGVVLDGGGAGISKGAGHEDSPVVSYEGAGLSLIAWSGLSGPPYESYRIWGKIGAWSELTPTHPLVWELRAERVEAGTKLSWMATEGLFVSFTVERRESRQQPWKMLACVPASGTCQYSWVDAHPPAAQCWYRLLCETVGGGIASFELEVDAGAPEPRELRLGFPAPNPAVLPEEVTFEVQAEAPVWVEVLDVRGALVRRVFSEPAAGSSRIVRWDCKDWRGRRVAAGVYFLRLPSAGRTPSRKVVVLD